MGLLLLPATRENLEKSIEKSVDKDIVNNYLTKDFINEIIRYSGIEGIRCWATTKSNVSFFEQIKIGDEVLLSEKNTGLFTHYGVVIGKTENTQFGKSLWSYVNNKPWEYIYFLANITCIQIDKATFVQEIGYSEKFTVPGPLRVEDSTYSQMGSVSSKYDIPVRDSVAEVDERTDYSTEDIECFGKRRDGHNRFSKRIKGNYNYKCCICGITEPEFLVASHISAWAEDKENRLNPKNGLCLCSFHDKAFEYGYIGFSDDYRMLINKNVLKESVVFKQLLYFNGRKLILPSNDMPSIELLKKHRTKHKIE